MLLQRVRTTPSLGCLHKVGIPPARKPVVLELVAVEASFLRPVNARLCEPSGVVPPFRGGTMGN